MKSRGYIFISIEKAIKKIIYIVFSLNRFENAKKLTKEKNKHVVKVYFTTSFPPQFFFVKIVVIPLASSIHHITTEYVVAPHCCNATHVTSNIRAACVYYTVS